MENQYNLNSLYKAYAKGNEDSLTISVFRGSASFVVFKKGSDSRRPAVKVPLSIAACLRISDILTKLMEAAPETRLPFVQMSYNKDARTFEQEATLVFFKDEKKCCGIEVSSKEMQTPIKFFMRSPSTFSTGNEPMTDEQKAQLGLRELKLVLLDQLPVAMMLGRFNMPTMPNRGGGNGGGGGYSRPNNNNGGGSRDPYGSSSGSEEDSIFG